MITHAFQYLLYESWERLMPFRITVFVHVCSLHFSFRCHSVKFISPQFWNTIKNLRNCLPKKSNVSARFSCKKCWYQSRWLSLITHFLWKSTIPITKKWGYHTACVWLKLFVIFHANFEFFSLILIHDIIKIINILLLNYHKNLISLTTKTLRKLKISHQPSILFCTLAVHLR